MHKRIRNIGIGLGCFAWVAAMGCESHEHRSMSTYEYNEDRGDRADREPAPNEAEREQPDSEYHMRSPGKMVVDPSRK